MSGMEVIRKYFHLVFGSRLILASSGRTMLKLPVWIIVLLALNSIPLVIVAALAMVGLGYDMTFERG